MSLQQFKVVEFSDGLAVVADKWLNERKRTCKWPNYTNQVRINKAIMEMENPADDWLSYDILKTYGSSDSYNEALELLKASEIDSEAEKLIKDREIYKKTRGSRARKDSSDSSIDSKATSYKERSMHSNQTSKNIEPPKWPQNSNIHSKKFLKETCTATNSLESEQIQKTKEINIRLENQEDRYNTEGKVETAVKNSVNKIQKKVNDENSDLNLAYLKEIVYICNKVYIEMNELKKDIKRNTSKILLNKKKEDLNIQEMLPFENMNELLSFTKKLEENEDWVNETIEILLCVGGNDDRVKINNMLEKIMTDEVGSKFSRKGQKGKEAFKKWKLEKVIIDVMLKCKTIFTESEIKLQIGHWLAGRKAKLERQSKVLTMNS